MALSAEDLIASPSSTITAEDLISPVKESSTVPDIETELSTASGPDTLDASDLISPSRNEPGSVRTFLAGQDAATNSVHNFSIWLESNYPTINTSSLKVAGMQALAKAYTKWKGDKYIPDMPQKDWEELEPEDRRKILYAANYERAKENYPDVIGTANEQRTAYVAGQIVGTLEDPTIFIPFGQSYKTVAAMGASLGAADISLSEYVRNGYIDPAHVAFGAVGGAAFAPAILAAFRGLGKGINKIDESFLKKEVDVNIKKANELIDLVDDGIARQMAERASGELTPEAAAQLKQMYLKEVLKKTGVSMDDFNTASILANRKTRMPTTKEEAIALLDDTQLKDYAPGGLVADIMQPISDRLYKISKPVWQAVRKFDMDSQIQIHGYIKRSDAFFKAVDKLPAPKQKLISEALANGDFDTVRLVFRDNDKALASFEDITKVHDEIYTALVDAGYKDLEKLPNFFHREVKNIKGLLEKLEANQKSDVLKLFERAAAKRGVVELTTAEKAHIANKYLRGFTPKEGPIGASKDRGIKTLAPEHMEYYADPKKAYHSYVRSAVNDINKKKLFGRDLIIDKETGALDLHQTLENSLGHLVAENPEVLNSSLAQAELKKLLLTRFSVGEQSASEAVQMLKNIGYATTLGNPISALTQAGDLAVSMYRYGIVNALKSIVGEKYVNVIDYGIIDIADELASSPIRTARFLQTTLKFSGFNYMDRLGKNTHLNSAYRYYTSLANTGAGIKKIEAKYGASYGNEFPELIHELKSGQITERVKLLLFHELADIQPISKTEMPVKYLQNPNGRIFYMLKSFTMKQLNLMKRDGIDEIAKGNIAKGVKNLTTLIGLMTAANSSIDVIKQTILSKEIKEEDVPDLVVGNIFKNFGASEYILNKGAGGKVGSMLQNVLNIAPLGIVDAIGTDLWKNATNGPKDIPSAELMKQVPLVGKLYYNWFGPGVEQELRKKEKERNAKYNIKRESRTDRLYKNLGL